MIPSDLCDILTTKLSVYNLELRYNSYIVVIVDKQWILLCSPLKVFS